MDRRVLVVLADGFEEVEAISPIDVLRRAGAAVTVAALDGKGTKPSVRGAHNVHFQCDVSLSDVSSERYDAIVLPGGMPGAKNLSESKLVRDMIMSVYERGSLVCAICASPAFVLGPTGILEGRRCTCYPGCEEVAPKVSFGSYRAVKDGNVITAVGPGAALEFGLLIAEALFGKDMERKLHSDMICS